MVAQDGFLTTHTLENVRLPEDELLREFVGDPHERIRDLFDPAEALMTGVVQNQDSYMKGRIGQRAYTDRIPGELADGDGRVDGPDRPPGRRRSTPTAARRVRDPRRDGHHGDTAIAVVDHLRAQGRPVGCVAVTSFRPFPDRRARAQPSGAPAPSAWSSGPTSRWPPANPLTREIRSALYDAAAEGVMVPRVLSFSAGLGSRDVAAGDLVAVFDDLASHGDPPTTARASSASATRWRWSACRSTCGRPAPGRCAAIRSAASAR